MEHSQRIAAGSIAVGLVVLALKAAGHWPVGGLTDAALEVHDLRARMAGVITFVDVHLLVPGAMSVAESHAICDRTEDAPRRDGEHLLVTIHVEPEGKAKHRGVLVL